jgi:hypothetical protein
VDWLFEDPWIVVGLGVLAEVLLGVAFWRTGRGAVLVGMGVVLVLTGLGLLAERLIVTDREAAEATLHAAADAVLSGDPQRVLRFVAPEADEVQDGVRRYMGLADFTKITIRSPETRILESDGRVARIRFTAHVKVRLKGGGDVPRDEYPVFLELRLRKTGGEWLVTNYENLGWGSREP